MNKRYFYIFILFRFSALFPISFSSMDRTKAKIIKTLLIAFSVSVELFLVMTTISAWKGMSTDTLGIANAIMSSAIITQRIVLTRKLRQIKCILNQLSKFEYIEEPKRYWLHILAFTSLITQQVLLIYKFTQTQMYRPSYLIFGFEFTEEYNNKIIAVFLDIYIYLFSTLPMHTFSMLYAAVCLQLVNYIKAFSQSLSSDSFYDYKRLLSSFMVIKSTVGNVDDLMSFSLFLGTIYFSIIMYFDLNIILHPELLPEFHMRVSAFSLFFCTFALFLAMAVSASMVADATSEIGTKAYFLQDNINNSTYEKQRFLMYTQKEVNLTLWKLIPVRRNFALGVIGGIFTYIMLFYGLDSK